ncbi:hypothetical protein L2E82_16141 [Cichorium intybus]|uniref:Uncharacterized protein n=1 Tax=Cichorium intybus TaxID=13427 RepID=A0ACB9F5W6_CICIN|nr:hypothetical protein L2E82_16141 [Cichorium intybus]
MQVSVKDQQDTYRAYLPCEEHVGKSTIKKSQTIESLLPDEEDLFSGVLDELECTVTTTNCDDEDFDLFSSSGGMELEENSKLYHHKQNPSIDKGLNSDHNNSDYSISYEHPTFHPQSLPISHEGFFYNNLITYESLKLTSVGFSTETNGKHLHMLNPYGPPIEHMFSGHHHAWSFSNPFQNHHLNSVIWSQSLPYDNTICAHSFPNEILPPVFMGPPQSCNKDLQIGYLEESFKPDLILNPVQVVGFQSKATSPHIKSHKSPESRDIESTLPFSVSRQRGRTRRTSHGRHETVSSQTDDKKYELDIERVLSGEDCRTTLMIKNIPNKYTSAMLLAAINEHNQGTYDFIYLPLDFKNKCNMGYAFINMIDPHQIPQFHKSFSGKKWEKFHSGKVACLAYGRIQGKAALIAHFQESSLMNEDKCCHPILFTTNGPNAGNQEPFPLSPNMHSRRQKNRSNLRQLNENQEISSTLC